MKENVLSKLHMGNVPILTPSMWREIQEKDKAEQKEFTFRLWLCIFATCGTAAAIAGSYVGSLQF